MLSHMEMPQSTTYPKDPAINPLYANAPMKLEAIKLQSGINY
jgi:hypothetical protein